MNTVIKTNNESIFFKVLFFFISILPVSLLLGSAVINLTIAIIDLLFLYIFFKKNEFTLKNKLSFYILLIFWLSLIINLFNSSDMDNSYSRVLGFIRFAILALSIQFLFENISAVKKNKIFFIWAVIYFIVSFDLLFEFIIGFNLIGNVSYMPGRLSSFLGNELKIGHYYFAFSLFASTYIYYNFKSNILLYLVLFSTLFISLIIGERANFIKFFFMVSFFLFFFEKKNFFHKGILVFFIILFLSIFVNFNNTYKERFWTMFGNEVFNSQSILKTINNSPYGGHWNAAWEIFNDNKIFGIGIKNFRIVSGEQKYYNKDVLFSEARQTTHPHQLHLEFLSETGIFGSVFFIFMIFSSIIIGIKNFFSNHNLYNLSSLLYFCASTILVLPTGSFFTTYSACIFWMIYGILMAKN